LLEKHTQKEMTEKEGKQTATRGQKKKVSDPFAKKEWFDIKAPDFFVNKRVGKMPVNKSAGARACEDDLKGRVIEINLADLQNLEEDAHRKIKLRIEDVQGRYCLTNFYGMDFTTDKLRSLVRKWQTLIEAHVEVRTTDAFYLRMFCIGFTKRRTNQQKKTCYAQSSQVKAIRAKMREIMIREATNCTLKELVLKFIPEAIGKMIEKECNGIFPLTHVYIRKVKLLQSPKFDPQALRELHDKTGMPEDVGVPVELDEAKSKKPEGGAKGGEKKEGGAKGGAKGGEKGGKGGAKGGEKKEGGKGGEEKKDGEKKEGAKGGDEKKEGAKGGEKKEGEKKGDGGKGGGKKGGKKG